MPMELRKIVFSKDEILTAVYDHCLRNHKAMPAAAVTDVEVSRTHEVTVVLHFDVSDPQDERSLEIGSADVAAAMIRYCSRIGVPLPRSARKALQPEGSGLAMLINLNYRPAPAAQDQATAERPDESEAA